MSLDVNEPTCGNCGHGRGEHYGPCYVESCPCVSYRSHTPEDADPTDGYAPKPFPHVPSMVLAELIGRLAYSLDSLDDSLDGPTRGVVAHYLNEAVSALDAIREFNNKGE